MGKFKQYLISEDMGMGAPPMGDPMGGGMGGAPPMGDPMGGGMGAPMGDPMGGMGGGPMGGDQSPPPVIPRNADVWEVLDSILNQKPFKHEEEIERQKQQQQQQPDPGAMDPMGGDPMGGAPPMDGAMGAPPAGPALMQ